MFRAILDENNICIGICNDTPLFTGGILVPFDATGMKYDNGVWVEVEKPEPEPTMEEVFNVFLGVN